MTCLNYLVQILRFVKEVACVQYAKYSSVSESRLASYYAAKAILWNLKNWRKTYRKRVQIQRYYRKLPDKMIVNKFLKKTSLFLEYYSRGNV